MKVLITGGSGFIGTNLVEAFVSRGVSVWNIDVVPPRNPEHRAFWRQVDIRDGRNLSAAVHEIAPTHIVHLAARADIDESAGIEEYGTNTDGVKNLVDAISGLDSVERCLFASTKLVCPNDYEPKSVDDYCPDTLYGKSKMIGEKIVRESMDIKCTWCIFRPTSIWGPWADVPYGRFVRMVSKGWYFHPQGINPPRSFGYVGNVVFQVSKMLGAPKESVHEKIFYVSDYDVFTIQEWANLLSIKFRGKRVRNIPAWLIAGLARMGDIMKRIGIKEPPISTFRLKNMKTDTSRIPLESIKKLTGSLPYDLKSAVDETVTWFLCQSHR
jgi:nucleoside-diphosphate-sugar epimerase